MGFYCSYTLLLKLLVLMCLAHTFWGDGGVGGRVSSLPSAYMYTHGLQRRSFHSISLKMKLSYLLTACYSGKYTALLQVPHFDHTVSVTKTRSLTYEGEQDVSTVEYTTLCRPGNKANITSLCKHFIG